MELNELNCLICDCIGSFINKYVFDYTVYHFENKLF